MCVLAISMRSDGCARSPVGFKDKHDTVREAMQYIEAAPGIQFNETFVGSGERIDLYYRDTIFNDSFTGNFAGGSDYANVTVINHGGSGGIRLDTAIHELGHALGLGHPGPYNGGFMPTLFNDDGYTQNARKPEF